MSTDLRWQITSTSLENTAQLAMALGSHLRGGEVIELVSDVGGGKTTFVRSLAKGMGSNDKVASPSFTLSREYRADHAGKQLTMFHFDFYRLNDPGIMANELAELIGDSQAVVVVEWADIIEDVLPVDRLTIQIINTGETSRNFSFSCPESLSYLHGSNT